jgi:tetratricopeptide (TPR) repeat protein
MVRRDEAEKRYRESDYLKRRLPQGLFESGLQFFPYQAMLERCLGAGGGGWPLPVQELDRVLADTDLRTPALWLLGDLHEFSGVIESLVAKNAYSAPVHYHLGLRAMASRDYLQAEEHFRKAQTMSGHQRLFYYRILALAYANQLQEARKLANELLSKAPAREEDAGFWEFCRLRFELEMERTP